MQIKLKKNWVNNMKDIGKLSHTLQILEKFNLNAKKSFGQNFLVDLNTIERIASLENIDKETCVIEIGPGIGSLTEFLCRQAKRVIAYDIDERLIEVLDYTLQDYENVEIRLQDFLTVDVNELISSIKEKVVIVSNLPYYITTELLSKIVCTTGIQSFVGMMQKEVAVKLTNEISPLSLMMNYVGEVSYGFNVSNQVFIPKPHVDSAVISIRFKDELEYDRQLFFKFIQGCFKQRRKTIYNNLGLFLNNKQQAKEILETNGIDLKTRAEQLSLSQFVQMFSQIN